MWNGSEKHYQQEENWIQTHLSDSKVCFFTTYDIIINKLLILVTDGLEP